MEGRRLARQGQPDHHRALNGGTAPTLAPRSPEGPRGGDEWPRPTPIVLLAAAGFLSSAGSRVIDPLRSRKLLIHRRQIDQLYAKMREQGLTIVPLKLYFKGPHVKVEVGLAKGKKLYDKRQDIADRDAKRDIARVVRGKGPNPIPLILTHGWPWTFWDYKDVVGPLVDPAAHGLDPAISFDVVVPSLPGFTFSTPLRSNEVTIRRIARLWVTLMRDVLGYDRFAAAGGDWGALVTGELGHAHAAHVLGTLQTVPIVPGFDLWAIRDEDFAPDEAWMPARQREAAPLILPHVTVHSSDPQTLAYALADSPVGTAAWMWERRRNWSDCDGDVVGVFGRDFLCATASLYWLTNSIGSSLRIYKDHFGTDWKPLDDALPVMRAPAAVMISPKELVMVPRAEAERTMNLKRWTTMPKGGHFAVSERPEGFVGEVRAFFGELATAGPQ